MQRDNWFHPADIWESFKITLASIIDVVLESNDSIGERIFHFFLFLSLILFYYIPIRCSVSLIVWMVYGPIYIIFTKKEKKLYDRAQSLLERGKFDKAIKFASECIIIRPDYVPAYRVRGVAYNAKNDYDNALADLNQAIKLDPQEGYRYYTRSLVYSKMGNVMKEISDIEKAIELDGDDTEYYPIYKEELEKARLKL